MRIGIYTNKRLTFKGLVICVVRLIDSITLQDSLMDSQTTVNK